MGAARAEAHRCCITIKLEFDASPAFIYWACFHVCQMNLGGQGGAWLPLHRTIAALRHNERETTMKCPSLPAHMQT